MEWDIGKQLNDAERRQMCYICMLVNPWCLEPALAHRQGFKNTHVMTDLRIKRCKKKERKNKKMCVSTVRRTREMEPQESS